jgi:hypothetical protein
MNKKYDNNNIIIASRAYFLHHADLKTARIEGETLPEALPVAPSTPSTSSPSAT